ncbi:MAG TPA: hypothetical protein VI299_18890 [Polyangiales bacterium]
MLLRVVLPFLVLSWCSLASAQDDEPRPPEVAAEAAPERKKSQPMDVFALGVKFGVANVSAGNIHNPTYIRGADQLPQEELQRYGLTSTRGCDPVDRICHTAARHGYHIAIPIQLGGTGVGFRVEPYMTLGSHSQAYGAYAGPTFEFHLAEPLYFGFGFGLKAAYVLPDGWEYAADLYGRIPAWITLYLTDGLALVGELAFGAGASGYVSRFRNIYNPIDMSVIGHRKDLTFGYGRTWDASIGLRFP